MVGNSMTASIESPASAWVESVFAANERRLGQFLVQMVRDRAVAEDLLQDTFVAALQGRDRWAEADDPAAWLFGGDDPGVFSVSAIDGGDPVRLTTNPFGSTPEGAADEPTGVSPDGNRFLFIRFQRGKGGDRVADTTSALFIENMDGTGLRRITPYGLTAAQKEVWAAWSPDGREILSVAAGRAGHPGPVTCCATIGACLATRSHLFVIHPDGSGLHTITLQGSAATGDYRVLQPSWSPDGSKIVFGLWPSDAGEHIYTANADGSDLTQITDDPYFDYAPRWGRWG